MIEDPTARVTLHVKVQPLFVSDAMPSDAWRLIGGMRERPGLLRALGDRLDASFNAERLQLWPDPFWSGPRFLWEAPSHLREAFASATVVVLKGDANYRRLVGDGLWAPHTPLALVGAYAPAPVVCLRTMKSDPVVGLPPGLGELLDASLPRWRIDGQRGVLQTYIP
jgi:Damage-control phosphatase ARMT1-like domain